jgi:hypothetical protein
LILLLENFFIFFDQKLQFTYPSASIKDAQATREAFSHQKRTSSTSKYENSCLYFVSHFAFLDLDPDLATQINADPDPQPCENFKQFADFSCDFL